MNINNSKLAMPNILMKIAKEGNVSTSFANEFQATTQRYRKGDLEHSD